MSHVPSIVTIYFGNQPERLTILERMLRSYHTSGQTLPLIILTDATTDVGDLDKAYDVRRITFTPEESRALIRVGEPGVAFDVKGAMLWEFLGKHDQFLYVDSDVEFVRDIAEKVAALPLVDVALAPDVVAELYNAGVIWFGASDHKDTRQLYAALFAEYRIDPPGRVDLLEQDIWGMIRRTHEHTLPMALNWQSHFWGAWSKALVIHKHGADKNAPDEVREEPKLPLHHIVVIGTPHVGMVHDAHRDALDEANVALTEAGYIPVTNRCRSSSLVKARDTILANALRVGAKQTLFWDSDIIANPSTILRMLSHKQELIGALYSLKAHPGRWILDEINGEKVDSDGILRVLDIGTGFKVIRTSMLRKLALAYPDIEYESDDPNLPGVRWNFSWVGVRNRRFLTEDYGFDALADGIGVPCYADTKSVVGHSGIAIYPLEKLALPGQP